MRTSARMPSRASRSWEAEARVWPTNSFMRVSPNSVAQAPTKPPPKPLTPATPTLPPGSRMVVASPSRTWAPADRMQSATACCWS